MAVDAARLHAARSAVVQGQARLADRALVGAECGDLILGAISALAAGAVTASEKERASGDRRGRVGRGIRRSGCRETRRWSCAASPMRWRLCRRCWRLRGISRCRGSSSTTPAERGVYRFARADLLGARGACRRCPKRGPATWQERPRPGRRARRGLLPVFVGFHPDPVALPVLALIWGATTNDLGEAYYALTNGFKVGDTTSAPAIW